MRSELASAVDARCSSQYIDSSASSITAPIFAMKSASDRPRRAARYVLATLLAALRSCDATSRASGRVGSVSQNSQISVANCAVRSKRSHGRATPDRKHVTCRDDSRGNGTVRWKTVQNPRTTNQFGVRRICVPSELDYRSCNEPLTIDFSCYVELPLRTSHFELPTSNFQLQLPTSTFDFKLLLPTSHFKLPHFRFHTSDFKLSFAGAILSSINVFHS